MLFSARQNMPAPLIVHHSGVRVRRPLKRFARASIQPAVAHGLGRKLKGFALHCPPLPDESGSDGEGEGDGEEAVFHGYLKECFLACFSGDAFGRRLEVVGVYLAGGEMHARVVRGDCVRAGAEVRVEDALAAGCIRGQ